ERPLPADNAVNDCRVRLQLHFLLEPIDEYRRDPRALLGLAGFLLDDRSGDDELVGILERQVGRTMLPDFLHPPALFVLPALDDLLARSAAREVICSRQQRSLLWDFLDVAGKHVVFHQARDDLFRGEPLGDCHLMLDDLALADDVDHVAQARLLGKKVLAVFEFVARLAHPHAADEDPGLIDHAFALQDVGNVAHAGTARNIHHLLLGERSRSLESLLAECERHAGADGGEQDEREQGAARDDDGMARTRGMTLGLRHAIGLERRAWAARGEAPGLYHGRVAPGTDSLREPRLLL